MLTSGQVYCCGYNRYGQLGVPRSDGYWSGFVPGINDAVAVATSETTTCVVRGAERRVWCWGYDSEGQMGVGPAPVDGCDLEFSLRGLTRCFPPTALALDHVVYLEKGWNNFCAVRDDGSVWCWGVNYAIWNSDQSSFLDGPAERESCQRDTPDVRHRSYCRSRPVRIQGIPPALQIVSARGTVCILDRTGEVWCWGDNLLGELGDGTRVSRTVPVRIIARPE
ncbi:MAG: hypothetical protein HY909_09315 [Deltaproteobacteria bacterium]|nr:hypothetical protein [Deltaproteobacteria bacterium]